MNSMILSIGSNCNSDNVANALEWLQTLVSSMECSGMYETPPAKGKGRPYTNAVVRAEATLDFDILNSRLKEYERQVGRDDECRLTDCVPVDIDIVVWNHNVMKEWDYRQDFFKIGLARISD